MALQKKIGHQCGLRDFEKRTKLCPEDLYPVSYSFSKT
jgi:hypothetical protein